MGFVEEVEAHAYHKPSKFDKVVEEVGDEFVDVLKGPVPVQQIVRALRARGIAVAPSTVGEWRNQVRNG